MRLFKVSSSAFQHSTLMTPELQNSAKVFRYAKVFRNASAAHVRALQVRSAEDAKLVAKLLRSCDAKRVKRLKELCGCNNIIYLNNVM